MSSFKGFMTESNELKLSKTTTNKAKRNNLDLHVIQATNKFSGDKESHMWVTYFDDIDDIPQEYDFSYIMNDDGSFTYLDTLRKDSMDMPAHIKSEKHLRDLLPEIRKLLK